MGSVDIPADFLKSCSQHEEYPKKLVAREQYGLSILARAKDRLEKQKELLNLFEPTGKILMPYRNIYRDGSVIQMKLNSEDALGKWLGGVYSTDPEKASSACGVKEDPACRFMYVLATLRPTRPLHREFQLTLHSKLGSSSPTAPQRPCC